MILTKWDQVLKGAVGVFLEFRPVPPSCLPEGFLTISGPRWNSHGVGRCDFYYANVEGRDFYYGNGFWGEVWVSFSSTLELASFGQSDAIVSFNIPENSLHGIHSIQLNVHNWLKSPSSFPAHVWLSTYYNNSIMSEKHCTYFNSKALCC